MCVAVTVTIFIGILHKYISLIYLKNGYSHTVVCIQTSVRKQYKLSLLRITYLWY